MTMIWKCRKDSMKKTNQICKLFVNEKEVRYQEMPDSIKKYYETFFKRIIWSCDAVKQKFVDFVHTQTLQTFTCSKSTIERLEKSGKYVQS